MLTNAQMQMMIDSAAKAYTYRASNPAPAGTTFIQPIDVAVFEMRRKG